MWYNEYMSKYDLLWKNIDLLFKQTDKSNLTLSFEEIEKLGNVAVDHSFLKFKKELTAFGYKVDKISLKQSQITFCKK